MKRVYVDENRLGEFLFHADITSSFGSAMHTLVKSRLVVCEEVSPKLSGLSMEKHIRMTSVSG